MEVYNKLVRDKIPEIIESNNEKPVTRILSDEEAIKYLNAKLLEETNEYLADENIEELADILEVFHGILKAKNIKFEDVENIRIQKKNKRGGFDKKIFLEYVE